MGLSKPKREYECCRYNGRGLCLRCSCARSGTSCTSFLPFVRATVKMLVLVFLMPWLVPPSHYLNRPCHLQPVNGLRLPLLSPPHRDLRSMRYYATSSHSSSPCGVSPLFVSDHVVPSPNRLPLLPTPSSISEAIFVRGKLDSNSACSRILSGIYSEIVHWRKYYFTVPLGRCGKSFVLELARLFKEFPEGTVLESVVLKAVIVACILLLQRPHSRSKPKDHSACLTRRLKLWKEGEFEELLA